jgi:serine/threonine protein kinase/Tfp pilus assembly protein PilF
MATSPEKWETVKALFVAALELDSREWPTFLRKNCPDNGIRTEVERLLKEHDRTRTRLSTPVLGNFSLGAEALTHELSESQLLAERFRVVRFIAGGGMGEVYEAEDEELRERVAIKTIRPEILAQPNAMARFKREVHLARKVTHPNVCRIFDLFRDRPNGGSAQKETVFISMELLRGKTLGAHLQEHGRISMCEALPLVQQMASALAAAHAVGIVHRDFKPGNVVLVNVPGQQTERAVVTDFGLALQSLISDETASISTGNGLVGTPAYMSPEQLEGRPATTAADIYALGLVIYEMVTGARPFQGDTPLSAAVKRLSEAPPTPRRFEPALSLVWESVILRCLERDPAKRFSNAEEVGRAISSEYPGVESGVASSGGVTRKMAGALAAVLLTAVVGIGYGVRTRTGRVQPSVPNTSARRSIAVLGFKNVSGRPDKAWLSEALSETLNSELSAGEQLRIISGENVARMKSDLALPDAEGYAPDTLARIRKNLGTDFVIEGSYLALGKESEGQIRVDAKLQDAHSGESIGSVVETGKESDINDLFVKAGKDLRARLGVTSASPVEEVAARASLPSSPQVARLYSEGLDKLRVFDALGARNLLEKASTEDPNFAPAHSALAEVWSRLGYGEKAIREAGKAVDLSTSLSHEEQLSIQGQYRSAQKEWGKAVEIYGELFGSFPDNIDYGLYFATAQTSAGRSQDALSTLARLRKLPSPEGDDPRIDLSEAFAADTLGDYQRELNAARRAAEKGDASGGRFVVARALKTEGAALRALGETKPAMATLEQASNLYTALGDKSGRPLITIGNMLAEQGDFDRAQETFEQALRGAREMGDKATECFALTNIAHVHLDRGDLGDVKPLYVEALGIQREIEDKRNAGSTLSNLGHLLYEGGNYPEANKTLDESLSIAREISNRRSEAYVLGFLGELLYAEGNLAESKARSEESLAIARDIGHKRVVQSSLAGIGLVLLAEGDFNGAQKEQEEAVAIAKELGEKGSAAQYRLALAQISLEKGLPTEAEAMVREPIEEFRAEKARGQEALAQVVLARSLLAQNKIPSARTVMEFANAAAARTQHHLVRFEVDLTDALVSAASGRTAAAETSLRAIISKAATVGCVPCEFEAKEALGEVEMKTGKTAVGRASLERLEKDAAVKGFLLLAHKATAAAKSAT